MRPVSHPTVTYHSDLSFVWTEAASSCPILAAIAEEQPGFNRDFSASHGLSPPTDLPSPIPTRS